MNERTDFGSSAEAVDLDKIFPNGEPAMRKTVSRLCAIVPEHLHERIWARWHAGGWKRAEVEKLIAEVKEAKKRLPEQPLSVALQADRQSAERTQARITQELEAQARREADVQMAWNHMLEQRHAWEEYEARMRKQWRDPCGLYGPPTLASEVE